ncbi:Acyl carrier protein (ACP) [Penicillium italicum]|uniref:Acyl carrier protein n=1 Tax=Penicillium italicum TaxID=40296 RepID=A0A0A2KV95_PENIT|nr:Acyl carrier protein (ACP) [Penicillium italicum]
MFRSAIARSLKASAPRVIKTPAPFHIRSSPIAAQVPQFTPCFAQGVRLYSAPAGLSKNEAEGRIVNLLKNFDKVSDASKATENIHQLNPFDLQINGASHFSNDLGLDSLDTVEVVMAIEEEFSIEIPDKEADQIHSVEKAVEYILAQPDAH